jgi:cell division septation protein DedD
MSELIQHQDVVDDAFHEIQLSGKQLVFLFMATTIVAVVIFLCGVQVGRGVKAAPADTSETIAAALPQATRTAQPAAAPTEAPAVEPPAPAKEDDLTYSKRLQSDAQPPEKVKAHVDAHPPASAPVASAPPPSAPALTASTHKDVPPPATAQAATPKSAQTAAPAAGRPGVWVVQVQALKAPSAAAALAQRLVSKGYPAFVLSPVSGAPSIYRVQVGRYNDRREAEQIARRLEKEEQFKPWISH